MPLRYEDKWVWDFWFAQDGDATHIFYLQAPKNLGNPDLRHRNASIGHAVSHDLENWTVLPDALQPSPASAFDDLATWTGSVIQHDGLWYMFYTGLSHADGGLVQRIGLATSMDLIAWQKHTANPLIKLNPQWYEQLDTTIWPSEAWRDPYVIQNSQTGQFHAFITARITQGQPMARGTIGHAVSDDLLKWRILPPISVPRQFGHMEVPQIIAHDTAYFLVFSAQRERQLASATPPATSGIYYMVSDDILGSYTAPRILLGDNSETYYGGKLIHRPNGSWALMAALINDKDGHFIGEISDPIPVEINSRTITTTQPI